MSEPRYRLVLRAHDGTQTTADFTSTTGDLYDVGDELRMDSGEVWRVVALEDAEPPHLATLICEPLEVVSTD